MSGEVVRSVVIDKESAPEAIADIDKAEIRRGEGLVLLSGENEKKVGHVGEFAVDLMIEAGFAKEESIEGISSEAQAVIDQLRAQVATLTQEKEALERRLNNELEDLRNQIAALRTELDDSKKTLDDQIKEDFGDVWVARKGNPIIIETDEGYTDEGWTALEDPYKKDDGRWYIQVTNGEVTEERPLNSVHRARIKSDPDDPEPQRINLKDRLRYYMRGGPAYTAYNRKLIERDGRRVVVTEQELPAGVETLPPPPEEGRGALAVGALAVGALVGGLVAYAIWGRHGHDDSAIRETILRHTQIEKAHHAAEMKAIAGEEHLDNINHVAEMKAIASNHADEMKTIAANHKQEMTYLKEHVHDAIVHAHGHEMLAIHGNEFTDGQSNSYFHPGDYSSSTGDFSRYQYPWDYTHNETQLHVWADRASRAGHKVHWIVNAQGKEILQVDGTTNTQKVLEVITKYR